AVTTTPNVVPVAQVDTIDLDYLAPGQSLTFSIGAVSAIYTAGPNGASPTEARDGLIAEINDNPFLAARVTASVGTTSSITLTAAVAGTAYTGTVAAAPASISTQTTQESKLAASLGLTASVTDNKLSISVADGYGLAILDMPADGNRDISIDQFADGVLLTDKKQGFSNLFGFNDFYEMPTGGPVQASTLFASTSVAIEANFQIVTPTGRTTITGNRTLAEIVEQINATQGLDATASLYRLGTQWGIRLSGSDAIAVQNLSGNKVTFDRQELGAAQRIDLVEEIDNRPELIARGRPITTPPQNDTYRLETADGAIAGQMAALFSGTHSFPAVAGLPLVTTTFTQYSAQIAGQIAGQASEAKAEFEFQTDFTALLDQRISAVSEVDIDQELANLIELQNAYSASARVIDTVTQLFDILNSTAR
ncbi:MAG: flagellar basal body rod C-terminal domain-containing protein, partial [Pseudomonadota bacterium]